MAKKSLSPEAASWIRQFKKYGIPPRAGAGLTVLLQLLHAMAGDPAPGTLRHQVRGRLRFVVDYVYAELPRSGRRRKSVA